MVKHATHIKAENQRRLLLTLLRHQPISRVRLARCTGLSSTTVTHLTAPLLRAGILAPAGTDQEAATEGAGRPPQALVLVPKSRLALGIHLGVRRAVVALSTLEAELVDQRVIPHPQGESPEGILAALADAAQELLAHHGITLPSERIVGVGVGASGLVEAESGVNVWAPALEWHHVPIAAILGQRLGLPVAVENNVRCMALAESLFGAGQGKRVLAFIYARMGVGAGLVVDGRIYRGAWHAAGEIGHWTVLPHGGELCRCGNRGCLETLISERALVAQSQQLAPAVVQGQADPLAAIFAAARTGHLPLRQMLAERAEYLGIALANLVNALNPELILLGGLLHEGYDLIQPVVEQVLRQRSFHGIGAQAELRPATFGVDSGPVGAATLALNAFFYGSVPARHTRKRQAQP
ncbi:ROK family protein [Litorilinea aerophila]|uniref:ROK family protein n=1 Tax=Litorilinea aerophila TaxID=1204385 RepID=A0A540VGG7_9CHLR|nr:ROK family protein [Litorilinea aerophila]MCC9076552.1 ROK family protein [Litorilinea aerophila]OUC09487.1 hypothetical protein RY27_02575 [Litorilinea aerophila]GIV79538.1 MAG: sugar kinase [Litorilinea sp.]